MIHKIGHAVSDVFTVGLGTTRSAPQTAELQLPGAVIIGLSFRAEQVGDTCLRILHQSEVVFPSVGGAGLGWFYPTGPDILPIMIPLDATRPAVTIEAANPGGTDDILVANIYVSDDPWERLLIQELRDMRTEVATIKGEMIRMMGPLLEFLKYPPR